MQRGNAMTNVSGNRGAAGRRSPSVSSVVKGRGTLVALPAMLAVLLATPALAQTAPQAAATKQGIAPGKPGGARVRYRPDRFAEKAGRYYRLIWGVDSLTVKLVESGELVRFDWRVLDPDKASLLSDNKLEPSLEDPQAGVSLVIPAMEKIGKLRQAMTPEAGKSYWMTFSNKGRRVRRGDHVSVVIGEFRAD